VASRQKRAVVEAPAFPELLRKAQRHLGRCDAVMKAVVAAVGPCTLELSADPFTALVASIISQQISGKAAVTIFSRLQQALKPRRLTPQAILDADEELLRGAGLSTGKRLSLRDLADKTQRRAVDLRRLHQLSDEEVIEQLLPVRGIGCWTAQMFLIFTLGRLDVLPVADLGLRAGVQRHYQLADLPAPDRLEELARPWQPYRSIATWYIWRSSGPVPQSK
jgi:DNA-3-methyladenine glycosylase II